jgi:uroporphyrinogen decarboxylase
MPRRTISQKERVLAAIRHHKTDRVPRGELVVEGAFLDRLYPEMARAPYIEKMKRLADAMGLDLVTVRMDGKKGLQEIRRWVSETPYFVMALVDGLFWNSQDPVSFEEFVLGICRGEETIRGLIQVKRKRALEWIRRCLDAGAHGVIVGDDLAYNRGPFVSPADLETWIFPGLQEMADRIREARGTAFLHSCGNLMMIMNMILASGFDGLHGLAPSAGNDPLVIRQLTRGRLALMGVFEVDTLSPDQLKRTKADVLPALAAEGGYILGSAEGLSANTPLDSAWALYA